MKKFLQNPLILFALIGLGILVAAMLVKGRAPLEHAGTEMPSKPVEIIQIQRTPFNTKVTAYGTVEPTVTLSIQAEVSGKISYLHPDLKQGSSLAAGTVVARIDPQDYEISLRQTEADLSANQSALKQLQVEQASTRRLLKLAKENLLVGEKELDRIRSVWERKLIARSTLDTEEQAVIQLQQQVSELQGQLNSFTSRKATSQSLITRAEEQVKGQKATLGRTEITLPFAARIGEVSIEKGQFVNIGSRIFEALDVDGVEINAQLPIIHMRSLVAHLEGKTLDDTHSILSTLNLTARVKLVGDMPDAWWDARVLRLSESVDPTRRTLGIIVGVDHPYEKVIPGRRPPLLKGMFTAVELIAPASDAIVIPRKAIHHGRVYTVDKDNRLKIKAVDVQLHQGNLAVVKKGLEAGDRIVINDMVPVIDGMPLSPVIADHHEDSLVEKVNGQK
ncbi:MAG: HlyD family secretion protein [Gammaproteobacteria bacterium]